jgi:hypothetical protein
MTLRLHLGYRGPAAHSWLRDHRTHADDVWSAGLFAAVALVGLVLFLVYAWSKWRADHKRERLERSSPQ